MLQISLTISIREKIPQEGYAADYMSYSIADRGNVKQWCVEEEEV